MIIFERLEKLCKKHHITIAELERELNFSKGSLHKWRDSSPSADKVKDVAVYFHVTIDYLMGATSKPNRMVAPPELAEYGYDWIPLIKKARASGLTPEQVEKLIDAVKDIGK